MAISFLKIYRESLGLSQYQLSLDSGIPNYILSKIENRKREPSHEELQRLSKIFGIDLEAINKKIKVTISADEAEEK